MELGIRPRKNCQETEIKVRRKMEMNLRPVFQSSFPDLIRFLFRSLFHPGFLPGYYSDSSS